MPVPKEPLVIKNEIIIITHPEAALKLKYNIVCCKTLIIKCSISFKHPVSAEKCWIDKKLCLGAAYVNYPIHEESFMIGHIEFTKGLDCKSLTTTEDENEILSQTAPAGVVEADALPFDDIIQPI